MIGVGGLNPGPGLDREQVIFAHQPRHALVIHNQTTAAQLPAHPPIAVPAAMFQHYFVNRRAHFHLFFPWRLDRKPAIKSRPAYPRQHTHPLDRQTALQRHHRPHLVVDAVSPAPSFCWRRAAIFCKAPLKKSTSSVRSARSCFRSRFSSSSPEDRASIGATGPCIRICHRYSKRRGTSSSLAKAEMLWQPFIRATARRRNSSV